MYTTSLQQQIEALIQEGYVDFITGMAEGADIDFAKCVLKLRTSYDHITLEAALPYPVAARKHISTQAMTREEIWKSANHRHIVSPYYHRGCMQMRNQYMVDKSDLVLAVWNGECHGGTWNTIQYARSKEKPIRYIMLDSLRTL
jgi:uncharacterized phage-like protein YoqJ